MTVAAPVTSAVVVVTAAEVPVRAPRTVELSPAVGDEPATGTVAAMERSTEFC